MDGIDELAALLSDSSDTLVLTGAGISTESGIPDFRSPGTGLWTKMDPMELFSQQVLARDPQLFWQRGEPLFREIAEAEPNPGHRALAELEQCGAIRGIVTQNIDSLHQKAGSQVVLEVHGHLRTACCPHCGVQMPLAAVLDQAAAGRLPRCDCGKALRPEVVLFGDPLPPAFQTAWQWSRVCQLLLVVGSSLEVAPVCWLAANASKLAIVNLGPTQFDDLAAVHVRGKAGLVLTSLAEKITGAQSG